MATDDYVGLLAATRRELFAEAVAEVLEIDAESIQVEYRARGGVFTFEVVFSGDELRLRDLPNLTVDTSGITGAPFTPETVEFPIFNAGDPELGINLDRLFTSIDTRSRSIEDNVHFRFNKPPTYETIDGESTEFTFNGVGTQTLRDWASDLNIPYDPSDVEVVSIRMEARMVSDEVRFDAMFVPPNERERSGIFVSPVPLTREEVLVDIGGEATAFGRFTAPLDPRISVSPNGPAGQADPDDLPSGPQPSSWAMQRSSLRELVIDLGGSVASISADDVVLTNLGVNADTDPDSVVDLRDDQLSLNAAGDILTISLDPDQATDGIYQLELLASVTGGTPLVVSSTTENGFYALAGDWNGSGGVNVQDFATFAYWFGQETPTAPSYIDLNNSGGINIQDFAGFAANFGRTITMPSASGEQVFATPSPIQGDVDRNGVFTSADALRVINELDKNGPSFGVFATSLDFNADSRITAADALYVVNRLEKPTPSVIRAQDLGSDQIDEVMRELGPSLF